MEEATPGFVARPAQKVRSALFDVYNDRLIELSFSPYEKKESARPIYPLIVPGFAIVAARQDGGSYVQYYLGL